MQVLVVVVRPHLNPLESSSLVRVCPATGSPTLPTASPTLPTLPALPALPALLSMCLDKSPDMALEAPLQYINCVHSHGGFQRRNGHSKMHQECDTLQMIFGILGHHKKETTSLNPTDGI